ncbi:MAG: T9SS type A sorting domain-containing protein [Bacteroidota bacterium]
MKKAISLMVWLLAACSTYAQTCGNGVPAELNGISVGGMTSWDTSGDPNNETFNICGFSANANIVGLSWSGIDLSPMGNSNCGEVVLQLEGTVNLRPALGENNAPPCNNGYTGGSNSNLQELNLNFPADNDGCVSIEIFEIIDNNSNSIDAFIDAGNVTLTGCPQGLSLPIELTDFQGKIANEINIISWTTSSESNSAWHTLQRSADGQAHWKEIGRLPAAGNSTEPKHYVLEDDSPLHFSFYRLKETALDGRVQYSRIISVKRPLEDFLIEKLSPNPTDDVLSVTFGSQEEGEIKIEVVDTNGKKIHGSSLMAEAGLTNFDLNVGSFLPGSYFLILESPHSRKVKEFIKL